MDSSIWDQILARVETKVNRHSFYTWFRPTSLIADSGSGLTIRVPTALFTDWLTKHYSGVLTEALEEVQRGGTSVAFIPEGNAVAATPGEALTDDSPPADNSEVAPSSNSRGLTPRYTFDTFMMIQQRNAKL